jgi:hypothetical protein
LAAFRCVEYALSKTGYGRPSPSELLMPQMIIANRLRDGVVVFLAPDEGWVPAIAAGHVIDDEADAATLLAVAKRHEGECQVIDPQLIDVEVKDDQWRPTAIREAIRAFGPTIRTDLTEA